ncbi:hypothetical protein [Georgenia sp. H159]|uniref:hypothetical protein n=1 Tax=Georgenia sp. H159 TaxID=3076115 RepID=UPI002D785683|nr:hypothetical protein [Georgenia sp. H159]
MALTPLTRIEQATILALVEARRLDGVPADVARATSFLRQAEERLPQLPLLTSVVVRYGIAYDACLDVGEALLAAYGFRTTNGPGASTRRSAATSARSSTSRPPRGQRESSTAYDALGTRTATRPSRWVPRRPRRLSRSPGRSTKRPSLGSRREPSGPQTVRKKSRRGRFSPMTPNSPVGASPQVRQDFRHQPTMVENGRKPQFSFRFNV